MNLDHIIKEYERLKFESTPEKNETTPKKAFPHIVSKESFERMISSADTNDIQRRNVDSNEPICRSASPSASSSPQSIPRKNTEIPKTHSPPQMFQQTSVITSNSSIRKKSEHRRSIHRQRNIDESLSDSVKESDRNDMIRVNAGDVNMTEDDAKHIHTRIPFISFDNASFDTPKYNRNPEVQPAIQKSKSLEIPDEHIYRHTSGHPQQFTKHASFNYEEESAPRYMNKLHISHNNYHKIQRDQLSRDKSLSRDSSFSDSPTSITNSPLGSFQNSPLRRFQEHDTTHPNITQSNQIHQNISQSNHVHQHFNQSNSLYHPPNRSYEKQTFHHKFPQRKAFSLNSAPYDIDYREKNLRRIFSEEIVPEHPIINTENRAVVNQHMRRAVSYDLTSYIRQGKSEHYEKLSGSVGNFHEKSSEKKATKVLFPQHDNVNDYKNIFIKHIDDEATHARDVMENSTLFNVGSDYVNYFNNSIKNYQFINEDKKRKPSETKKVKSQQQNSLDNLVIGPYVFDPSIDDELAVCVTGLLTLPGSNEKRYPITVGELRRRIAPPEYLNKVDMISYVRLAKTSARELLEKHAIRPKHHSRKSRHSVISKMCEAECTELATGIKTLSEAYFPKEYLAKQAIASTTLDEEKRKFELSERIKKINTTKSVLEELTALLQTHRNGEQMQNYNLATHSYGFQNLTNNIELISSVLKTQANECSRNLISTGGKLTNQMSIQRSDSIAPMETEETLNTSNTKIKDGSE